MLRTKCILSPKSDVDGTRISIMSRHTLNDGKTPHPQIDRSSYDEWSPILAPPAELLGDYYKRDLTWEEFKARYLEYLQRPEVMLAVWALINRAIRMTVTLLCIEETPEHCHRRLLAEVCLQLQPDLEVEIM